MQSASLLSHERTRQLLHEAIVQVLLRDPESRVLTCALCSAESDHPSMIRHAAGCSYARARSL